MTNQKNEEDYSMNNLFERAVGYFVLEYDFPDWGLFVGDQIYIDSDPQTTARLVVATWDDKAHLCRNTDYGALWDCCTGAEAPACAEVFGGALFVQRALPVYVESVKVES